MRKFGRLFLVSLMTSILAIGMASATHATPVQDVHQQLEAQIQELDKQLDEFARATDLTPFGERETISTSQRVCRYEGYGPDHERDQFGHYLTYAAKLFCTKPVDYSLNLVLYQKSGSGWTRKDSVSAHGVSSTPYIGGGIDCRTETSTTYRMTLEGTVDDEYGSHNSPEHTYPCGV